MSQDLAFHSVLGLRSEFWSNLLLNCAQFCRLSCWLWRICLIKFLGVCVRIFSLLMFYFQSLYRKHNLKISLGPPFLYSIPSIFLPSDVAFFICCFNYNRFRLKIWYIFAYLSALFELGLVELRSIAINFGEQVLDSEGKGLVVWCENWGTWYKWPIRIDRFPSRICHHIWFLRYWPLAGSVRLTSRV